ncbi:beta strand repeat-containing protein [Spirosoma gilvum]
MVKPLLISQGIALLLAAFSANAQRSIPASGSAVQSFSPMSTVDNLPANWSRLPNGKSLTAHFRNDAGQPITTLSVQFQLPSSLVTDTSLTLDWSTDGLLWTTVPTADRGSPASQQRQITITGLQLQPRQDLFLRWQSASQNVALTSVQLLVPQAANITGTLSVSLTGDNNANGQINPGDKLTYTTTITNSGDATATGVNLTSPAPANTTLVSGSLKTSALARPDSYTSLISTPFNGSSVLTNDFGLPSTSVSAFGPSANPASVVANGSNTATSNQGATVLMQTNGTFTYTPTGSFVGFDQFGYTAATNTPPTDAAIVTVRVGTPVTAVANSYTITGNVSNTQLAGTGLLVNDTGDQKVVSAVNNATANVGVGVTTAQSGTVTVQSDGSFVYLPPPGYTGADSFTYTANNGLNLPSSAVVSLTIQDMTWFVNSGAAAGGNGTLSRPFNTLAAFQAVNNGSGNNPAAGDNIFLYPGSYTGGVSLLNTQKLIGAGATASLASIAGITLAPGSASLPATGQTAPTISNASGNSVSLASGNTVRGLTIGTGSANALVGNNFGTVTVADLSINTAGQALALNTGAVSGSFNSVSSTAGTNNIALTTLTGSFSINAGVLSGASGSSFSVNGGSVSVTYSGNLSQTNNAPMVNVVGGHTGTLLFQTGTLNATNGTGLQFDNADGTYTFNGTTTLNGGDAGIDITNGSGGTFAFPSTTITNPSGVAYREDSSSPTVSFGSTIRKDNNSNTAIDINAKSGGTTTFSNSITANTGTANSIDLTNNGGTVSFTGGSLTLTTTSGIGFNATGTFIVNVNGSGNKISSGTGAALNVVNTTIGASGLTFQSVAANGAANGIVLNNTGSSGGLTITGTGTTNASGGTIQNITNRGVSIQSSVSITLKNMQFTNANMVDASPCGASDNTGCNAAIHLNTVTNATLDNVDITGTVQNGINVREVSGFKLQNSTLTQTGAGGQTEEGGLYALNLFGTAEITNSSLTFPAVRGAVIYNTSKTLSMTVAGSSFNDTQTSAVGADGFEMSSFGTSNTTLSITNCSFLRDKTNGIQFITENSSIGNITVSGCTIDPESVGGAGLDIVSNGTSTLKYKIINNPNLKARLINVVNTFAMGNSTMEGRINNNVITSLSGSGSGIRLTAQENNTSHIAEVLSNTVTGVSLDYDIVAQARQGAGRMDVTIMNNNLSMPASNTAAYNIAVISGASSSTYTNTMCARVANNVVSPVPPSPLQVGNFQARAATASHTLHLQGPGTTAATYWDSNGNTPTTATGTVVSQSGSGSFTFNTQTCLVPTN